MKITFSIFLMVAWFALGSAYFIKGRDVEMLLCFVLSSLWLSIYEQTKD